ncbi:SNF2 family DNA-dependent ATPase [Desarmillaria tabescens]|uniref:SNF2 family DNA-dependent ATPase n=1 Tax=Armillaria tabescens TaxID=1929756 RepID=A0AA39NG34_ARMTA|nr:SNF2 family DNA-dependent ATPase [Desarmillaria tabescens]KAK0464991.1 SNF2 family DNA-dependent ATPase [Desarmillaria tabescens]
MSGKDSSDPVLLFTPDRESQRSSSGLPSADSKPNPGPSRNFVIVPPILPSEERSRYKDMPETGNIRDIEPPVDEVMGEYRDNQGHDWYYARYQQGITHRTRKAEGSLPHFDPSGHDVHPKARPTVMLKIGRPKPGPVFSDIVPDSEEEDEDEEEEESSPENEDDYRAPSRRLRQRSSAKRSTLPFSPTKTRSQRVYAIQGSEDEDDAGSAAPQRRSTRYRKPMKIDIDEISEASSDGGDSDDYITSRGAKAKTLRNKKKTCARDCLASCSSALRAHRSICEKCHRGPTQCRRKKRSSEDELEPDSADEVERLGELGGWVRCLKCPVTAHWRCLASTQRDEILKAARERDRGLWIAANPDAAANVEKDGPSKRPGLGISETTEFICGSCMKGGICMSCMEVAIVPDLSRVQKSQGTSVTSTVPNDPDHTDTKDVEAVDVAQELRFRCFTCKRLSHYDHLPKPPNHAADTVAEIAEHYQRNWLCHDCASFTYPLDKILAWRPYPANAVEPPRSVSEPPNYKSPLPREYLVKWEERSYRRLNWVPHMWLLSTHPSKLRNFLTGGAKVELLAASKKQIEIEEPAFIFEDADQSRASSVKPGTNTPQLPQDAMLDAESRIPPEWKTVDRILDIRIWRSKPKKKAVNKGKGKLRRMSSDEEMEDGANDDFGSDYDIVFSTGEQPDDSMIETVEDWETRTGEDFTIDNIGLVVWAFIKWEDLGYDEASWDSPPQKTDATYPAFETALSRYIKSRSVQVPKLKAHEISAYENRPKDEYKRKHALLDAADLDLGQKPELKLMPFQVDGFNWLVDNWWNKQPCILADEMGLGKTVQIATFIGKIASQWKTFPALVVVPNSTITNWVREFERWAPNLRVVPFYGESKAREVIKNFELRHKTKEAGTTGAKFHVLITTYEALLGQKDFTPVFKNQPRWEVLVIDEVKSDKSLLFRKLNELNSIHRIIMTGTPLNNNIRELFNLMNFLDPEQWNDLEAMEKEHEELTEDLVKQLHSRLRPYFLRRIKSEVLQLPPKNEVIVPVSMTPLQKEIYRRILSHNLELLAALTQPGAKTGVQSKGRINNVLMQLRKCLQHPYLCFEDIEPTGLSPQETHEKLIDASAKLRLLKSLLPKLKARGHRVLLFSQFVIGLNIIEDFLVGEGIKYLRLDGNTKGTERQKGMDEFNRPGSDVFIYLLTTRAGGVGINLFSADTVIIYDPDFNPHQAIARAYRFGQQKTCLVFKLMVKASAEERIVQVGKKKMVLDHLIVQKMDDDDSAGENVQSILGYGAQALFESGNETTHDITYTDHDVDNLIEKTEKEGDQDEAVKEGAAFSFAKIWTADRETLEEVRDEDQGDSWTTTLQLITAEHEKIQQREVAATGRGVRRKAAAPSQAGIYIEDTPKAPPHKNQVKASASNTSDGSAYGASEISDGDASDTTRTNASGVSVSGIETTAPPALPKKVKKPKETRPFTAIQNTVDTCGLCGKRHGDRLGECAMTDKSENLAEFREMLILHADDEPFEERRAAVEAIDRVLYYRGHLSLVAGQPLRPVIKESAQNFVVKKPKPQAANGLRMPPAFSASAPVAGPSKIHAAPSASVGRPPSPMAGPSKRTPSPTPLISESAQAKKVKPNENAPCVVCGHTYHKLPDCPLIKAGPRSVAKEIKRLEDLPGTGDTVKYLKLILKKQKRRELALAADNNDASRNL